MKLKTLRDIGVITEKIWDSKGSYPMVGFVPIDELRSEAIKWVKRWKGFSKITEFDLGAIQSFMLFHNITEEDLK